MLDIMYNSGPIVWLALTANIITIILWISVYFVDDVDEDLRVASFLMTIVTTVCWLVAIYNGPNTTSLYYIILLLHVWVAYAGGLCTAIVMKINKHQHSTNPQEGTLAVVLVLLGGIVVFYLLDLAKGWII